MQVIKASYSAASDSYIILKHAEDNAAGNNSPCVIEISNRSDGTVYKTTSYPDLDSGKAAFEKEQPLWMHRGINASISPLVERFAKHSPYRIKPRLWRALRKDFSRTYKGFEQGKNYHNGNKDPQAQAVYAFEAISRPLQKATEHLSKRQVRQLVKSVCRDAGVPIPHFTTVPYKYGGKRGSYSPDRLDLRSRYSKVVLHELAHYIVDYKTAVTDIWHSPYFVATALHLYRDYLGVDIKALFDEAKHIDIGHALKIYEAYHGQEATEPDDYFEAVLLVKVADILKRAPQTGKTLNDTFWDYYQKNIIEPDLEELEPLETPTHEELIEAFKAEANRRLTLRELWDSAVDMLPVRIVNWLSPVDDQVTQLNIDFIFTGFVDEIDWEKLSYAMKNVDLEKPSEIGGLFGPRDLSFDDFMNEMDVRKINLRQGAHIPLHEGKLLSFNAS